MSIPVMLLFDFISVITLPGAKFSCGNVQRSRTFLDGDREFKELDFSAIYHDSPLGSDNKAYVHNMRMSEVSVEGDLPLIPHLRGIFFRTQYDLQTFEHLLRLSGVCSSHKALVERVKGSLFLSRGFFVNEIGFNKGNLSLTFNSPVDFAPVNRVFKIYADQLINGARRTFDKEVQLNSSIITISNYLNGDAIWTIRLEDQLAFSGPLRSQESELF